MCLRTRGLIPAHAGKTPSSLARSVTSRAHPRSRGENTFAAPMMFFTWGSSPLTRGKLGTPTVGVVKIGLIPAHAGKTKPANVLGRNASAHPRSRGENIGCLVGAIIVMGSSPLTRGKQPLAVRRVENTGLIPAHAGKTPRRRTSSAALPAHPRSRGENIAGDYDRYREWGSSPLTRGKHRPYKPNGDVQGLIPAHAGKTQPTSNTTSAQRAHPRSRGENNT